MRYFCRLFSVALLALLVGQGRALAAECWQGWGYLVDPRTLAFKSEQQIYVTDGPVNWLSRD